MREIDRYVFVGNREYVLKEMIKMNLNIIDVWVMENSFLHNRLLEDKFIHYKVIKDKKELLSLIDNVSFDILISNGCKYILPISQLKQAKYINIHPSFLPDLKGMDPINAAILFNRDCGATCHWMDDKIDNGKIISRIKIPVTFDLDASILYQLAFKAEIQAFKEAYNRSFEPMAHQPVLKDSIYFSMHLSDRLIDFNNDFDYILRQVRAFGYNSKGLFFKCNNKNYRFFRASEIKNQFILELFEDIDDFVIGLSFENSIVFKFQKRLMRFDQIINSHSDIHEGDMISNGEV